MSRNRKVSKKMSVVARRAGSVGALMVLTLAGAMMYICASSSCKELQKRIGEKEKTLERLEGERERECARWEELKTPEKLEQALARHGLAMRYAKPSQIVRLRADGRPVPGQLSVARESQRSRAALTASYKGAKRRR